MLQILRSKAQGTLAWIIVLFIGIAFTFFGLGNYFTKGDQQTAAKVDGQKITWQAVDAIYGRIAPQYGEEIDPKQLKQQILMQLIQRVALLKEMRALGFNVDDQQVARLLMNIPAFQVDGQFSKEQYLQVLAKAHYTDALFRQELSQDALLGQLEQGIMQSSFTTPTELENTVALVDQKRDFSYLIVKANAFQTKNTISESEQEAYYKAHKADFIKPEQVVLEYVELSLPKIAATVKPSPEEVAAFYKAHQSSFDTPERVHARHILIMAPMDDKAGEAKAKAKIEEIAALLQGGKDFSDLAKAHSQDVGSAKNGGDLGWFVRGQMVPEFEEATFALSKPGHVSAPVRTQFGYHLIQLIAHKKAEVKSLAEATKTVEAQLKREKAEALFLDKLETAAKLAFEQPSLDGVAASLGLEKLATKAFDKNGGEGLASHPAVLKVAFSDALLKDKHNSEPIKISDDKTVVVRVKSHTSAAQETFLEAKPKIRAHLMGEKAIEQARLLGESMVKKIQAGEKPEVVANQYKMGFKTQLNAIRSSVEPSREVIAAVFQAKNLSLDPEKREVNGFSLPNGDYLVLLLKAIKKGQWSSLPSDVKVSYQKGLVEFGSQLEYALYTNEVLHGVKVKLSRNAS